MAPWKGLCVGMLAFVGAAMATLATLAPIRITVAPRELLELLLASTDVTLLSNDILKPSPKQKYTMLHTRIEFTV